MVENKSLQIKDLCFKIGNFAWDNLNLSVKEHDYFILTGPNGTGKSVLIKLICGLLKPISGSIYIGTRRIDTLAPWKRNIGYVPQDGLLFPNRTVKRNIEFGLEVRGISKQHRESPVQEITELLKISHLNNRMPQGLSGGERQRVCLARALVIKPDILLLDEPVSAIDEDSRDDLCCELRQSHLTLGTTTLHVSHNTKETSLVADQIGIIKNGRIEQKLN